MHTVLDGLIELLKLERIENNIFRGDSRDIGSAQVFGGQVLGQALSAAQHTVEDRVAHSLHAYFLRRGDMNAPIVYEVDRARDGGSFSTRPRRRGAGTHRRAPREAAPLHDREAAV